MVVLTSEGALAEPPMCLSALRSLRSTLLDLCLLLDVPAFLSLPLLEERLLVLFLLLEERLLVLEE